MSGTPTAGQWVEVEIEVPRFSIVKRSIDHGVEYVSPIPCPFNYGGLPDTVGEDGDPLDAVVLGRRHPFGARVSGTVVGCVRFVDDGLTDDKLVIRPDGVSASENDRRAIVAFFNFYAMCRSLLNRARGRRGETRMLGLTWLPEAGRRP